MQYKTVVMCCRLTA